MPLYAQDVIREVIKQKGLGPFEAFRQAIDRQNLTHFLEGLQLIDIAYDCFGPESNIRSGHTPQEITYALEGFGGMTQVWSMLPETFVELMPTLREFDAQQHGIS